MTPDSWHAHAQRTLEREQRREPPPTPEGEITVQSALEGMARIGELLREGLDPQPWMHPYEVRIGDGASRCIHCGEIGSYIHTRPEDRVWS